MPANYDKANHRERPATSSQTTVTPSDPCPVRGGDHKCSCVADGLIICGRQQGEVPGFRYLGEAEGDPQWGLYRAGEDPPIGNRIDDDPVDPNPPTDRGREAASFRNTSTSDWLEALALARAFPEKDAASAVVGIDRRYSDDHRRMIQGGRRGLYHPKDWERAPGPVLYVEGRSDTATLTAVGLAAIGQPSNSGGADLLAELLSQVRSDRPIVVLGENDAKQHDSWPERRCHLRCPGPGPSPGQAVFSLSGPKDARGCLLAQNANLGGDEGLEHLGKWFLTSVLRQALDGIVSDSLIEFDDPDYSRLCRLTTRRAAISPDSPTAYRVGQTTRSPLSKSTPRMNDRRPRRVSHA